MDIDTKGFAFFVKFLVFVIILFAVAQYGSRYITQSLYVMEYNTSHIEERLDEIKRKRSQRAVFEDRNRILDPRMIRDLDVGDYVPDTGKFVAIDLGKMKLDLYEEGLIVDSFNVLSKGREGSRWETPSGLYDVITKERNHFSSIGRVYMPYSMQFFGNFFIHGWPYYSDGTEVEKGYSGGCVRLSTKGAREVFEFVEKDTKIFVYDGESRRLPGISTKIRNIPKPSITAQAAFIADVDTGGVYFEKNAEAIAPIASLTKLMTAIVANETISFDKIVTVEDYSQSTGGHSGNIKSGDSFFVEELMHPLLMESNNDVAHSLSAYYGDKKFVEWMNNKAAALGMIKTKFDDPSGISQFNASSAHDLFRLVKYIHDKQSFVLDVSKKETKLITAQGGREYIFHNFHEFSDKKEFRGGKTGFTNVAKETMISVFSVPVGESSATISVIVLGSEDRARDTKDLLQWFSAAAVAVDEQPQLFSRGIFEYFVARMSENVATVAGSLFSIFTD